MRLIQLFALVPVAVFLGGLGCQPQSRYDSCVHSADEYCSTRGGCTSLLHALEVKGCISGSSAAMDVAGSLEVRRAHASAAH